MNEPVYFLKLELENVRCFGEKAELDLSDGNGNWRQWTVILGDNGTGKTTLLQVISLFEFEERVSPDGKVRSGPKMQYVAGAFYKDFLPSLSFKKDELIALTINRNIDSHNIVKSNVLIIEANTSRTIQTPAAALEDKAIIKIFGYGANRIMGAASFDEIKNDNYRTLFYDDSKLINAEEWLKELELAFATSSDIKVKNSIGKKKEDVKQTLINLLPDIRNIRFTEPTAENQKSNVEFLTPYNNWVTIHQLSLGYKTMVAWMVDLAARMFNRYPESDNPLAEPAIVLVDEIDLHLHPKWQRKIFGYLSERFPKTQFVVTAHSPLVVQSAPKDANIVVLRKEGDHVVIDNDVQSVHNWRLDQILSSDLFGGIPSRNSEVEKDLERRKDLIQKQILSQEEQAELEKLNRKADKIPQAESEADIEAKEIIRKAAEYYRTQGVEA